MIIIPSKTELHKIYGNINKHQNAMPRCACVACNSCTCACSCRRQVQSIKNSNFQF